MRYSVGAVGRFFDPEMGLAAQNLEGPSMAQRSYASEQAAPHEVEIQREIMSIKNDTQKYQRYLELREGCLIPLLLSLLPQPLVLFSLLIVAAAPENSPSNYPARQLCAASASPNQHLPRCTAL
jgi:hypothetical protein